MIKINALGDTCPIPVIKAKTALKEIDINGTVLVSVDNEISKQNLEKMAKELGFDYTSEKISNDEYNVKIVKGYGSSEVEQIRKEVNKNKIIVVISSDKMGLGNDELGQTLMKGFIYALTEQETLPDSIIFYNGGVKLTVEGSSAIDDLNKLSEKGVSIVSCGACLNYYGLTEKLKVGEITNMYTILEKMMSSDKIIKP